MINNRNDISACRYIYVFYCLVLFGVFLIGFSCINDKIVAQDDEHYMSLTKETIGEYSDITEHQKYSKSEFQDAEIMFFPPYEIENIGGVSSVMIDGHYFRLELAITPKQKSKGLMGRSMIGDEEAMLFVYEIDAKPMFWMKNTVIALDLIFIDSTGLVESIYSMDTQIGVPDRELNKFSPNKPVRYALEIRGGLAREIGLKTGSMVLFN
jgi:uncharacterized membrane protein (UPF0127 family)